MLEKQWPGRFAVAAMVPLGAASGALVGFAIMTLAAHLTSGFGRAALLDGRLPWYTTRAAAITAYLLLSGTTLLGLGISTRLLDRLMSRASAFALHEWLSWLALACVGLHVFALLVDTFQPFSPLEVLVPFTSSYREVATGLGTIGLYLLAIITVSFYARARIGQRAWRLLHYGSFALYLLATAHGIFSGAGQDLPWMQWVYVASASAVGFLLASRILEGRRTRGAKRPGALDRTARAA